MTPHLHSKDVVSQSATVSGAHVAAQDMSVLTNSGDLSLTEAQLPEARNECRWEPRRNSIGSAVASSV